MLGQVRKFKWTFKNWHQRNFSEEEDDESAFVKLMADELTMTYIVGEKERKRN